MVAQSEAPIDIRAAEQQALEFHEKVVSDAIAIWREGLNVYSAGMGELRRRETNAPEQYAQISILLLGWQANCCAYDLALRGYYLQALNLLRPPVEYWMSYWYLRCFAEEHEHFTDKSKETPRFDAMRVAVEDKAVRTGDTRVKDWIKRLHKYPHVDSVAVLSMFGPGQPDVHYLLGPQQDRDRFRAVVAEAILTVVMTLEAVDNLRQLMGLPPLAEFQPYAKRVETWQLSPTT